MTFFTAAASAISSNPNKRILIEVAGAGEGRIRVIITPDVGEVPDDASSEMAQVYALMARPLVVTGKPEEVESALAAKLAVMELAHTEGDETLMALRQIKEQAKADAAKAKATPATVQADESDEEDGPDRIQPTAAPAAPAMSIGEGF